VNPRIQTIISKGNHGTLNQLELKAPACEPSREGPLHSSPHIRAWHAASALAARILLQEWLNEGGSPQTTVSSSAAGGSRAPSLSRSFFSHPPSHTTTFWERYAASDS
ncbi:hypothetical protein H1C71_034439, partial [Ictidomys tridecemlineatus]